MPDQVTKEDIRQIVRAEIAPLRHEQEVLSRTINGSNGAPGIKTQIALLAKAEAQRSEHARIEDQRAWEQEQQQKRLIWGMITAAGTAVASLVMTVWQALR